jgi:hypothetical protein
MMENTRSKGVTFWGWWYIILSLIALLGVPANPQLIKVQGTTLASINMIICAAYLICGIFILQLNETARQAVIILCISSVFVTFFFKPTVNIQDIIQARRQQIIEQVNPEFREKALMQLEQEKEAVGKTYPILRFFAFLGLLIFQGTQIFFFIHPKVKEQFRQGGSDGD